VHSIRPCELRLFLPRYTCDLHASSYVSCMDMYGDCENACMLKYVPVSLAYLWCLPKTPLVVTVLLVCFRSYLKPDLKLVSFRMFSSLFGRVCLICGHVWRPPIGWSASSNMISSFASPSTTALAALSDVSLYSTSMCDLSFLICVFSYLDFLSRSRWFVSCRKSLYRCYL